MTKPLTKKQQQKIKADVEAMMLAAYYCEPWKLERNLTCGKSTIRLLVEVIPKREDSPATAPQEPA